MIYLSAQPDEFFFTWQIELQILNFSSLGIAKGSHHILIGVHPKVGISGTFARIIDKYSSLASFFVYEDTREEKFYAPSLRPHIIRKHFEQYPELANQAIFYHDSDILLKECPITDRMLLDDVIYMSDTRHYLDSRYVQSTIGLSGLSKICAISGITIQDAINNDVNCGGAQYLLKNTDSNFWAKIETRCNRIYHKLSMLNEQNSSRKQIQAWCADMWAIFYTLIEEKRLLKVSDALQFCWSDSPIEAWDKCAILHYTGNQEQGNIVFRKNLYKHYSPVNDFSLSSVSRQTCGIKVVEHIERLRQSKARYKLDNTVVVLDIPINVDTSNLNVGFLRYLDGCFSVEFLLVSEKMVDCNRMFSNVFSVVTPEAKLDKIVTYGKSGIKHLVTITYNILVDPVLIYNTILYHYRTQKTALLRIQNCFIVDKLMKKMFEKVQDIDLLYHNKNKFFTTQAICEKAVECIALHNGLNQSVQEDIADSSPLPALVEEVFLFDLT